MNLKVKIPKKFKGELSKRFNYENCEYNEIGIECALCVALIGNDCEKCPFLKFQTNVLPGCQIWLQEILGKYHLIKAAYHSVKWLGVYNKQAKAELSQLRLKSKELIEWI